METLFQSNHGQEKGAIPAEMLNTLVGRHVVGSLGSPDNLLKVKVHAVGNNRFRVNVVVGPHMAAARIANSFFVTADPQGNIVDSSPKISRQY